MSIYKELILSKKKRIKKLAVLIDPDKTHLDQLDRLLRKFNDAHVDYILVGGSLILDDRSRHLIDIIKSSVSVPVILFPGNINQIQDNADALLFLSLISGRNPELLIGKHVEIAAQLKKSSLEIISTGYMLIDGGKPTTVSYMSHTQAIPRDKDGIAVATAVAGELLGLKMIYLEAGSGAIKPVSSSMISAVSQAIDIPLIVGGGIRTPEKALENINAGADIIVVGNALEKDPELIIDLSAAIHSVNSLVH